MHADFFTKPLQGMLFYCLHDLIMNLPPENQYHLSHRSVLQDTDEGRNKSSNNPANSAQGIETSSGACIPTRRISISTDITSNSQQDGVSNNTHTISLTRINLK